MSGGIRIPKFVLMKNPERFPTVQMYPIRLLAKVMFGSLHSCAVHSLQNYQFVNSINILM